MKLTHLNFIHFFLGEKEYSLEVLNTVSVEVLPERFNISIRVLNDHSIQSLLSFFRELEQQILFFVGHNESENDVLTINTTYRTHITSKGVCKIVFDRIYDDRDN